MWRDLNLQKISKNCYLLLIKGLLDSTAHKPGAVSWYCNNNKLYRSYCCILYHKNNIKLCQCWLDYKQNLFFIVVVVVVIWSACIFYAIVHLHDTFLNTKVKKILRQVLGFSPIMVMYWDESRVWGFMRNGRRVVAWTSVESSWMQNKKQNAANSFICFWLGNIWCWIGFVVGKIFSLDVPFI